MLIQSLIRLSTSHIKRYSQLFTQRKILKKKIARKVNQWLSSNKGELNSINLAYKMKEYDSPTKNAL